MRKIKAGATVYMAARHEDRLFGLGDAQILATQQRQLLAGKEMSVVFGKRSNNAGAITKVIEPGTHVEVQFSMFHGKILFHKVAASRFEGHETAVPDHNPASPVGAVDSK